MQMEAAGLNRIMAICRELGHPKIEAQLAIIENIMEADDSRTLMEEELMLSGVGIAV